MDLEGKRVFIRSDLNVPLDEDGNIIDDTRIRSSLETIVYALKENAYVMVTSHLGRPVEGQMPSRLSLKTVGERILVKQIDLNSPGSLAELIIEDEIIAKTIIK